MNKSYQIFYFPFHIKKNENVTEFKKSFLSRFSIKRLESHHYRPKAECDLKDIDCKWERIINTNTEEETMSIFDTKSYYHSFVHKMLFDKEDQTSPSIVKHFRRKECTDSSSIKFEIVLQPSGNSEIVYTLQVDEIAIDLYTSTLGILTIYVNSDQYYEKPSDILNINYYGRYLYKSYRTENTIKKLSFIGLCSDSEYVEIPENVKKSWELAGHIAQLLKDFQKEHGFEDYLISPVFDNKMFVSCFYNNHILGNMLQNSSIEELSNDSFWQNFVNVDYGSSYGCQNFAMRKELCQEMSYLRWQNFGTLYGISKCSFVCLTNSDYEFLYNGMRNIYPCMIKIVLFQRASFLYLLDKISIISENINNENINEIYKTYIDFAKNLYFKELTSQIQGVELYEKLQKAFKTKEFINELDAELSEVHSYQELKSKSEKTEDQNNILNLFAAICLPASLVAGIFGMNSLSKIPLTIVHEALIVIILSGFFLIILLFKSDYRKTLKHFIGFKEKRDK